MNTENRKTNITASYSKIAAQKDHCVPRQLLPEANKVESLLLEYDFFWNYYDTRKKNTNGENEKPKTAI